MTAEKEKKNKADSFYNAKGEVLFGLTNDYMFKAVLGENQAALKGLICSLLHMTPEKVIDVDVVNPIVPGDTVESKDMILDVKVCLDNHTLINLEMQLARQNFWPERSLGYLCRTFDNLKEGESYLQTRSAIHIGFIDFDLFAEESPEFYATYHLANDKTHHIYTSKFTLSVVNLKRIDEATEEDKEHKIDYWARLFKSTTWEEIQMLAKTNNAIAEAAQTMYQLSDDEMVRERCRARQEHYRILQTYEEQVEEQKRENERIVQTYEEQVEEQRRENERIVRTYEEQVEEQKRENERIVQTYEEQVEEQKRENERIVQTYEEQVEEQRRENERIVQTYEEQVEEKKRENERIVQNYKEQIKVQTDELQEKDALIAKLRAQLEEIKEKN